jgi:hypothetical protein
MKLTLAPLCFVALLGIGSEAIAADKVIRVGFLRAEAPDVRLDYFRNGMRKLGYVEGRNLIIEQRLRRPLSAGVGRHAGAGRGPHSCAPTR